MSGWCTLPSEGRGPYLRGRGRPTSGLPRRHRLDDRRPLPLRRVRPSGAGGCAAGALGGPAAGAACLGTLAGVPLVAAGITDMQLMPGLLPPRAAELFATVVMATAGVLVGLLQVRLATRPTGPPPARALLGVSGAAILLPMVLAGCSCSGLTATPSGSILRACSATTAPSTPWVSPSPACWPGTSRRGQEAGLTDEGFRLRRQGASLVVMSLSRSGEAGQG